MADVAIPPVTPPPETVSLRKPADAAPAKAADPAKRPAPAEAEALPVSLANKIKLQIEKESIARFTYTFFDAETGEVRKRWPRQPIYKTLSEAQQSGQYLKTLA